MASTSSARSLAVALHDPPGDEHVQALAGPGQHAHRAPVARALHRLLEMEGHEARIPPGAAPGTGPSRRGAPGPTSSMPGSNTATPTSRRRSSGTSPLAWMASTRGRSSSSSSFVVAGGGREAGERGRRRRRGRRRTARHGRGPGVRGTLGDPAGRSRSGLDRRGQELRGGNEARASSDADAGPAIRCVGTSAVGAAAPGVPHVAVGSGSLRPGRPQHRQGPDHRGPGHSPSELGPHGSAPVSFRRACTAGTRPRASHESRGPASFIAASRSWRATTSSSRPSPTSAGTTDGSPGAVTASPSGAVVTSRPSPSRDPPRGAAGRLGPSCPAAFLSWPARWDSPFVPERPDFAALPSDAPPVP